MIQNSVTCRYSSGNDNEASQEENDGFHFGGFSSEKNLYNYGTIEKVCES